MAAVLGEAEARRELQAEVDALFAKMEEEGRDEMTYDDCQELPFMTRCIMETLRPVHPFLKRGTFAKVTLCRAFSAARLLKPIRQK